MSTRHLLNMTMGAFAMLLLAAIGVVFSTTGSQGDQNTQIDLAVRQQVLAVRFVESRDFMTADFVTLSKTPDADWAAIAGLAQEILEGHFGD